MLFRSNLEDMRSGGTGGGRGMGRDITGAGIGVIVVAVWVMFLGVDLCMLPGLLGSCGGSPQPQVSQPGSARNVPVPAAQDARAKFVSLLLADTENTGHALAGQNGQQYREPKRVLLRGPINSARGHVPASGGAVLLPWRSESGMTCRSTTL